MIQPASPGQNARWRQRIIPDRILMFEVPASCAQRFRKAPSALEYAADLTPVVAAKEARASWNARGMAETA